ncbi:flagellar basal body P-ring formation chaperone FlgA [Pseudomonadales bacterium]|nr:flagellar basal body P-ring formation chaperone FlgA [Pseudomonadales bacterium]
MKKVSVASIASLAIATSNKRNRHHRQADCQSAHTAGLTASAACIMGLLFWAIPGSANNGVDSIASIDKQHWESSPSAQAPEPATANLAVTINATEIQALTLNYVRQQSNTDNPLTRFEYSAAPIDSRLTLRRCSQPLSFTPQKANARAGRKLIKVRCDDHKPWSVFIPIQFAQWQSVVTAARPIQRNDIINAADIVIREQKLQGLSSNYLIRINDAIGTRATRPVDAGKPLNSNGLAQPKWIKRGDQVIIIANSQGVSAKMAGTAMGDGSKGQQIKVRNLSSKRVIKARVIAPGKVQTVM